MSMKLWGRIVLALSLALLLASGALAAMEKAEMIDGTHWTKWSDDSKLVYIRGLTNFADFMTAAHTQKGKNYEFCLSKVVVNELKAKSLGQIAADVDAYYKANPGKMDTSVIEVVLSPAAKEKK
jgi:hypothetical protein